MKQGLLLLVVSAVFLVAVEANHMDGLTWDVPVAVYQRERIPRQPDPTIRDCSDVNNVYLPTTAVNTTSRLSSLRIEMEKAGFDAYIVPSEDEHLTEYIAPRYKRREWISGFSGSQGTAVITSTEAALWADGRYFLQAERELDCNWKLMKSGQPDTPSIQDWITNSQQNLKVGANPFVFSIGWWKYYEEEFRSEGVSFNQSLPDLVDIIWNDRPGPDGTEIIIFPIKYAGKDWTDKVFDVRKAMDDKNADYVLLTLLDEIAWLFNLRGNDIPYSPIFISYALIGISEVRLYVNMTQTESQDIQNYLNPTGCEVDMFCVNLRDYDTARDNVVQLSNQAKVWMSSTSTTYGMYSAVNENRQIQDESPIKIPKSVKNEVERDAMKNAQIYDAIALSQYFIWLEQNVPKGVVDEISGSEMLESLRRSQEKNKGPSFESISASGPNAALIHYGTSPESNRKLTVDEPYLIDSGGHYFEGTTDTTRTLHFGTPTEFQREAYTRVLMGVINVETAIFPSTLDGNDIGVLAKQPLYDVGLDYRHGSGHGIGQYLCIHEYPPGLGTSGAAGYPFQVGMFTSVEPGYYEDGEFGIRLENVAMIKQASTKYNFGEYSYLKLEATTLVPYQTKMIDEKLLSDRQLEYLNDYHAIVLEVVGAEATRQGRSEVNEWLKSATLPIVRNAAKVLTPNFCFTILILTMKLIVDF